MALCGNQVLHHQLVPFPSTFSPTIIVFHRRFEKSHRPLLAFTNQNDVAGFDWKSTLVARASLGQQDPGASARGLCKYVQPAIETIFCIGFWAWGEKVARMKWKCHDKLRWREMIVWKWDPLSCCKRVNVIIFPSCTASLPLSRSLLVEGRQLIIHQ